LLKGYCRPLMRHQGSDIERLWLEKTERRLREFREGKVKGMVAEEIFRRASGDISCGIKGE